MTKGDQKNYMSTKESCGRIEEPGNYAALARAAWAIAEERNQMLDEIERLLDAGENDAAITMMREYIRPNKKPVSGETHGKQKQSVA